MTFDFETTQQHNKPTSCPCESVCQSPSPKPRPSGKRNWVEELPRSLVEHPVLDAVVPVFLGSVDMLKLVSKHVSEHLKCDADVVPLLIQELLLQLARQSSTPTRMKQEDGRSADDEVEEEERGGERRSSEAASSNESSSASEEQSDLPVGDRSALSLQQLLLYVREHEREILGAAERLHLALQTLSELGFPTEDRAAQLLLYIQCKGNLGQVIIALMQRPPPQAAILVELPSRREAIVCSACQRVVKLEETRFKCGHCSSFDLCEACEPTALHNPTHIFLKIRSTAQLAQGSLPTDFPMLTNRVRHPRKVESRRCYARRQPTVRT